MRGPCGIVTFYVRERDASLERADLGKYRRSSPSGSDAAKMP